MCAPDVPLAGPQLLMLADDRGAAAAETVTHDVANINAKSQGIKTLDFDAVKDRRMSELPPAQ
jgi:hypothetical protein